MIRHHLGIMESRLDFFLPTCFSKRDSAYPDANRNAEVFKAQSLVAGDRDTKRFRIPHHLVKTRIRHNNQEFIPTRATNDVGIPVKNSSHDIDDGNKCLITSLMTEGVIDLAKIIQIKGYDAKVRKRNSHPFEGSLRYVDLPQECPIRATPIERSGQRILDGIHKELRYLFVLDNEFLM